ncbi:hypothetical protein [Rosenbergiella epipactidis]|uniref:hypothetical protein n=1 Tax=Rosenbergiella epipactidis TaxID=1544694 RepID=UPI001F4F3FE9|nr:hypothetical protein [Rosenbergiella epipactidis]
MSVVQRFYWFVMDGRAEYNTQDAQVFEVIGEDEPDNDDLGDWSDMGACLVRAEITNITEKGDIQCGEFEFIRVIE